MPRIKTKKGTEGEVRGVKSTDVNFIWNSWLNSYRSSKATAGLCNDEYFERWGKVVADIKSRSDVVVLCNPDDEDHLFGWVCGEYVTEGPGDAGIWILHYVYLKQWCRREGFAEELIRYMLQPIPEAAEVGMSHLPPNYKIYLKLKLKFNAEYDPELVSYGKLCRDFERDDGRGERGSGGKGSVEGGAKEDSDDVGGEGGQVKRVTIH